MQTPIGYLTLYSPDGNQGKELSLAMRSKGLQWAGGGSGESGVDQSYDVFIPEQLEDAKKIANRFGWKLKYEPEPQK